MINTSIYPCTDQTISAFNKRIKEPYNDIPSVVLTEDNVRDLQVIWMTINELSKKWSERKKTGLRVPDHPTENKAFWGYFAEKWSTPSMPILEDFIQLSDGKGKVAIDLGCGNGEVTQSLLKKGWTVIAVDNSQKALERLSLKTKSDRLTVVRSSINKYTPDAPADLVICKNVLSYINPAKFEALWGKIHNLLLKEKGILIGTMYTASSHPDQLVEMNKIKEVGGWLLPDRRMVRPLLEGAGYKIEKCIFHKNLPNLQPKDQMAIHFIAEKGSKTS